MKRRQKKLHIKKETLRTLENKNLSYMAGADCSDCASICCSPDTVCPTNNCQSFNCITQIEGQ